MPGKLTQPKVRQYRNWLGHDILFGAYSYVYDEKSRVLLDRLFALLEQIAPAGEDGARTLWFRAERGPIEDYGDADELIAEGEFTDRAAFVQAWERDFPDEVAWYAFSAIERKAERFRAVLLGHRLVIMQDQNREMRDYPADISEFVQWLVDCAEECIEMLRAGTYNDYVREHLPPQHRVGTLRRQDYWDIWPEEKAAFFGDTSAEDVTVFLRLAAAQPKDRSAFTPRLASMTAGDFFRFCSLGYTANGYPARRLPPKKQYLRFADGRDEGLTGIDEKSPEAFYAWLTARHGGGHPWEVCQGGDSTHISLYVIHDGGGYWIRLAGSAVNRTMETVRFYLALCRAGVPVYLDKADILAERLLGTEQIGVVPEGARPEAREGYFPGQGIIAFMNLPEEDREQFVRRCDWQPIAEASLLCAD